jgi:hypothetical protein
MKGNLVVVFLLLSCIGLYADSPLTSTFFAVDYADEPLIAERLKMTTDGQLPQPPIDSKHLLFFDDANVTLDVKVAMVNVLGYGESENLAIFKHHLMKKYKLRDSDLDSLLIPPVYPGEEFYPKAKGMHYHDLVLLSYFQAMHDYFHPVVALKCAYEAARQQPASEAANYILGLVLAQIYFDVDWCLVYTTMQSARETEGYLTDRMRVEAVASIFSYIDLYKSACAVESTASESGIEEDKYSEAYWKRNPVYKRPVELPQYKTGDYVDLELLNKGDDPNGYFNNWITFDEMSDGTRMTLSIRNNGNVETIETNLQIEIREPGEDDVVTAKIIQEKIPVVAPAATIQLEVIIPYYWIYDPDADFIIRLDFDNMMQEKSEKNNSESFQEMG